MAEPAQEFSLWVFDFFGKVYVSIEDLAVRRMYVGPKRLLFFILNKWFFLPTVKRGSSNGGESYETYCNPALLDRGSSVTTGYPALRLDAEEKVYFKATVFSFFCGFGHTIKKHSYQKVCFISNHLSSFKMVISNEC